MKHHTPGPWKHHIMKGQYPLEPTTIHVKTFDGWYIASVNTGMSDHIANAELLASAPDLLKERDELSRWKKEAMEAWGPVLNLFHDNGEKLGIKLGESVTEFIVNHFKAKL